LADPLDVTVGDLLGVLRRQWLLALVWLLGSLAVVHAVSDYPPVYWTRAEVRFLPPQTSKNLNTLEFTTASVIATAGLVARSVTSASQSPATATTVLLHDRGVREGTSVVQPNSGGQWAANFEDPILDVQAVGATPEEADRLREDRVMAINAELDQLQADVAPKYRITTKTTPADPMVAARQGSPQRAVLVLAAVLGALGLWVLTMVDRAVASWRHRRRRQETSERGDSDPRSRQGQGVVAAPV
jgi:hypothetical protein